MKYKINGQYVTEEEWDRHGKARDAKFGNLLDDMLESRQAPRGLTDDVYFGGVGTLADQIADPMQLEHVVQNAMRHGYTPKSTDFYRADIAQFEGDPRAFFNHGHGRGEIRKRLAEMGMYEDREGDVKCVQPLEDPYKNPIHKLSPTITKRIKKNRIKENPDLARADQRELEAEIVETHGWNKDR
jgi:Fe2+ transport system protein FeoA